MEELEQAIEITKSTAYTLWMKLITRSNLEDFPSKITSPKLIKAFNTVKALRSYIRKIEKGSVSRITVAITLLRYALHIICFDHVPKLNKIWALASACIHAETIRYQISSIDR